MMLLFSLQRGTALRLSSGSAYLGKIPVQVSNYAAATDNSGFVGCIEGVGELLLTHVPCYVLL